MRDDFNIDVKRTLAARVGNRCSNPACLALTSGPQKRSAKSLNIGVAAHITAASPGGPRYDSQLTQENREGIENGIWLCQNCAKFGGLPPQLEKASGDLDGPWRAFVDSVRVIARTITRDDFNP